MSRPDPDKLDLKKTDAYRAKRGEFRILDLPSQGYLAIDGEGDPNTAAFGEAVEAHYPLAYALKFASKGEGRDFVVMPLEGLWWADDMAAFTRARDKSRWSWTLLILQPGWIDAGRLEEARAAVARKGTASARSAEVRFESLDEGRCVQTLHLGSFDDEAPVLARMHDEFIPAHGLVMTGRHHEIYLSDPRRTAPARLRTILRQPVASAP